MKANTQDTDRGAIRAESMVPWLALLFLGSVALGAWFLIGPALGRGWYYRPGFGRAAYAFAPQVLLLFVLYGLALWAWHRGARAPVWILLGGAVILHVLVLFAPLPQSQDFYQYLFYGRMQAVHGANPMVVHPSQFRGDPWYFWIRWYSQPSVYGPAWILVSFGVVKVAGQSLATAFVGLKLVVLALDLAVMGMIMAAWRGRGEPDRGAWGLLAYAWNPLILISVPLAGASDVALAASFLGALLARRRGRTMLATVLLTLATLVKVYAVFALILHLWLLLRERDQRTATGHAAVAVAISALLYAPYWAGLQTFSGLLSTVDLTNVSLAGTVQTLADHFLHTLRIPFAPTLAEIAVRAAGLALLFAAVVFAARRIRDDRSLWNAVVFVLAASLYLSPWSLYWYVVAPVALVSALPLSRLTYPILAFSGTQLIEVKLRPVLIGFPVQTALRYGIPITPWRRLWPSRQVVRGGGTAITFPVPSTQAVPQRAPAAE